MKNKIKININKKIPIPDLKRILMLIVYSMVLFAATFTAWYYFAVTIPAREAEAQNKRLETMLEMYKAKYCKIPYENAAVKRLCASKIPSLNDK